MCLQSSGRIVMKIRQSSLEFLVPGALPPGMCSDDLGYTSALAERTSALAQFMYCVRGPSYLDVKKDGRWFEGQGRDILTARRAIKRRKGSLVYTNCEAENLLRVMVTASPEVPQ